MDEVLNTEDIVLAKDALDDAAVGDGNALLVDLSITPFEDELPNRLPVWLARECEDISREKRLKMKRNHTHM